MIGPEKNEIDFKRGCQHPSNKFEILWQVAQNSFSLLFSYFVAQYVPRVVGPHVTNVLDLRYFCEHNPLFYYLNLIPCRY